MSTKNLKGTKTLENLMKSFAGESQARNRYTMFASIADKEGHPVVRDIFLETAENERLHAKRFYDFMVEGLDKDEILPVQISADYPVTLGDTVHNLLAAAKGEYEEFDILYKEFAEVALQEGFKDIAMAYKLIGDVEAHHNARYMAYHEALKNGTLYTSDKPVEWICTKCGHVHVGTGAPKVCPICAHPQGYFNQHKPVLK